MNHQRAMMAAMLSGLTAAHEPTLRSARGFGKTTAAKTIQQRINDVRALAGKPWKARKPVRIRRREAFQRRRQRADTVRDSVRMYVAQGSPEMAALAKRRG